MRYRRFGKTDWQVSEIGLGGSWFYGRPELNPQPISHGVDVVHRALELGVNYFDTAPLYGKGQSETVLGHALKGVTQPHYLATKVGYLPEPFDYTYDTVWRGFEASLKRLQRDRVDLVQIHETEQAGFDGIFSPGRALDALLEIKNQNLTTHIGITGNDPPLMCRILNESDALVSAITWCQYDLLTQQAKHDLAPTTDQLDVALIAASPLHGGLLGSKRDHWRAAGRFAELYDRQDQLEALLAEHDLDSVDTALRYLLSDPRISIILTGADSIEELQRSVAVSDGQTLDPQLIQRIEALSNRSQP